MHIVVKVVQGDDLGEDCGTASSKVQAQYFEWESSGDVDLKISSVQYQSNQATIM